jgi:hypothetical protein
MRAVQTAFLTAILVLALSSTASAGIIANGSVAFSDFVSSYVGATLSVATSITLVSSAGIITGHTGTPFGGGADNSPLGSPTVTTPTTFAVPLSSFPSFIVWGDGTGGANNTRYTFSVSPGSTTSFTSPNDLTISAVGTFHDTLGVYNDGTASMIFSFTQTGGPGNAISGSGTIQTPQAFNLVPEPETTILLGGALLAIGLLRRKKV